MNDNEKFITNTVLKISNKLKLTLEEKQELRGLLYECSRNFNIFEIEYKENSFMEMVEIYLQIKKLEGYSQGTLQNRFYTLRELNEFCKKSYKDITIADLRMFICEKQKFNKNTTINNIISQIKPFFKWLTEEEYITKDPTTKLKNLKEPVRLVKSLSTIDLERLRLACKDDRERALIEFAFSTGMRISEIARTDIKDLDMSNNCIVTIGKGNKEREVYFSDKTKFYLEKYLSSRVDNDVALFVIAKKPYKRLSVRTLQKIIFDISKRSGVESKVTPHIFRHTMATKMIEAGADITTVQYLLGHDKLETTQIYAEISKDKVRHQYKQGLNL